MRFEPAIDRGRLLEAVRASYGLPVRSARFIPVGYAAACYALRTTDGAQLFLKLWPDTPSGNIYAERRHVVLPLLRAIANRQIALRAPVPFTTRQGALWATLDAAPFAVFTFLPGEQPPANWLTILAEPFGQAVATVHQATNALSDVLPARETFEIAFEQEFLAGLQELFAIDTTTRPGLLATRTFIETHLVDLHTQLTHLHLLQQRVRTISSPLVLCHTDLGPENLLVDADGALAVLDWDDATVAPPEHDLQSAAGAQFPRFLAAYLAAGGSRDLQLDHFAFYLLRRYVGDLAVRFLSILQGAATPAEDADALEGMNLWGVQQWKQLDATLEAIQTALLNAETS